MPDVVGAARFLRAWVMLFTWLPLVGQGGELGMEPVVLQLKWHHQFQFAGYYAALEKGYYREAGLDVRLLEGSPDLDSTSTVMAGKAQFGVGTSSLLLQRHAGMPVVVLAAIFQHSPLVLLMREDGAASSVSSLAGQKVMLEPQSDELIAYLRQEGLSTSRMHVVPHDYSAKDFMAGKVFAMSAYLTDEPWELRQAGFPYIALTPRAGGIDFYGDNLFTTEDQIRDHPERVQAFLAASLRGWQYALTHRDEIIDLIIGRYHSRKSRAQLEFEADAMIPLIRPDVVEIGYMYPGRWRHIADTYAELGMLPADWPLNRFIYQPQGWPSDRLRLLAWLAGVAGTLFVVGGIALYIAVLNRRLRGKVSEQARLAERLRQSEAKYRILFDMAPAAIVLCDLDTENVVYFNQKAMRAFGAEDQDSLLGRPAVSLFRDHGDFRQLLERVKEEGTADDLVAPMETRDERCLWMQMSACISGYGEYPALQLAAIDITALKTGEEALRRSERKFRELLDIVPTGIIVSAVADARILFANRKAAEIAGDGPKSLIGRATPDFYANLEDRERILAGLHRDGMVYDYEMEAKTPGGSRRWLHVSACLAEFDAEAVVFTALSDITQRRKQEGEVVSARAEAEEANRRLREVVAELELLASTDRLTGAWNRRRLEQAVEVGILTARREAAPLSLLMFDIDHFKAINDLHGHHAGDAVLVSVVSILRDRLPPGCALARWGGEEFLVLAPGLDAGESLALAEAMRLAAGTVLFPEMPGITLSCGVAELGEGEDFESCLKRADTALYRAKNEGRNRAMAAECWGGGS